MQIKSLYAVVLLLFSAVLLAQKSNIENKISFFLTKECPKNGPGAAVLIAKDNTIIFKKAYGLADIKTKKPVRTDMIFQIGSMTNNLHLPRFCNW